MSNQHTNDNENQKGKSLTSPEGSGSAYHREHAGHIEGYGEMDPDATDSAVQAAIQEKFEDDPVIRATIEKFNDIANEENKEC